MGLEASSIGAAAREYDAIASKYPTLSNVRLHEWPDRLIAFGELPLTQRKRVMETGSMTVVNESALAVLERCDGTRTTDSIVDELARQFTADPATVRDRVTAFLRRAEREQRHVVFRAEPLAHPVAYEKTGSRQYYTPVHLSLEVTTRCNFVCKHCYRFNNSYVAQDLAIASVRALLDDLRRLGCRTVEITGGEWTIHPHALEIVEYAHSRMQLVGLLTNGYALTEEMIERLAPCKDKLLWSVSLDSHDPAFHDRFRGVPGAHERMCKNIRSLVAHGFEVRASMSVTRENFSHIRATMAFAYDDLRVGLFQFSPVMPIGRGAGIKEQLGIGADQWREVQEYAKRYESYSALVSDVQAVQHDNCGAGWRAIAVGANGTVRPCVMFDEGYVDLGNILEEPIEKIMNRPAVERMRRLQTPTAEECGPCADFGLCGGCFYRGAQTTLERRMQGAEPCSWARRHEIDTLIASPGQASGCFQRSCTT